MSDKHRINNQIIEDTIDLINEEGVMEKNVYIEDALNRAMELDMDLVEMSPPKNDRLAVCKILDYGKLRYKEEKKNKNHKQITKEIRFNFRIADHDLETKNKNVIKFLEKHMTVKYVMELKGREKHRVEEARQKMEGCLEVFINKANWTPLKESYGDVLRISTMLSPVNKN